MTIRKESHLTNINNHTKGMSQYQNRINLSQHCSKFNKDMKSDSFDYCYQIILVQTSPYNE